MVGLIVGEGGRVQRRQGRQARVGAVKLGDGDGPVEGDYRVRADGVELA